MTSTSNAPWPKADEAELKRLWESRLHSARQIAEMGINGTTYTRNAIIAKVHRMRLAGGTVEVTRSRKGPRTGRRPVRKPDAPGGPRKTQHVAAKTTDRRSPMIAPDDYVPMSDDAPVPLHQRRTVETIERNECRWPMGDPQDVGFHFCGGKALAGHPYCYGHVRRAYQPYVVEDRAQRAAGGQTGSGAKVGSGHANLPATDQTEVLEGAS